MSAESAKSVRRNTMASSEPAGRRVISTFLPVCNPTPVARIEVLSVRCPTMLFCYLSSFLKRAHRDGDDFENNARRPRKDAAVVGTQPRTVRRPTMEALRERFKTQRA